MRKETILAAYAAIGETTPLKTNCGLLCGAACCACDADGQGGVTLLPGEAELMGDIQWGSLAPDPQMNLPFLSCHAPCERDRRPFFCRIFPLCPVIGKSGQWTVRMDARARAVCPLSRSRLSGLDPDFLSGAKKAAQIIAADPEGEAVLQKWAELEAEFRKPLW